MDLRVTALFKAAATTDRWHEVHSLIFRGIILIFPRRRDVFLRRGHGGADEQVDYGFT